MKNQSIPSWLIQLGILNNLFPLTMLSIMNTKIVAIIFAIISVVVGCCHIDSGSTGYISNYRLRFERGDTVYVGNGSFSVSFCIEPNAPDTVVMQFGMREGLNYAEYDSDSTFLLSVSGDNLLSYSLLNDERQISFVRKDGQKFATVRMEYTYGNYASAMRFGKPLDANNPIADIWETSWEEFYYPFIPNSHMDIRAEFVAPDTVDVVAAYPVYRQGDRYICEAKNIISHSLHFAYLNKKHYIVDTIGICGKKVPLYQMKKRLLSDSEKADMANVLCRAAEYFESVFGDSYWSEKHGVSVMSILFEPTFYGLRQNVNFMSSPIDDSTYYAFGLVHEMGHRWLGEYNLLIADGQPGAYFIKESLNVFMRMMFGRATGLYDWQQEMQKRRKSYDEIKGTKRDCALIDMRYNSNFDVVYSKGPVILDDFAQRIGYDEMVRIIGEFYRRYDQKIGLRYEDFISTVADLHPEIADELNQRLRSI